MKTLVITDDPQFAAELPGLALLTDATDTVSIRHGGLLDVDFSHPDSHPDVALVDGRTDLVAARNLCGLLRAGAPWLPIVLVVVESGLVAINEHWCVDEVVVPGLTPAELDMRLRLAISRAGASDDDDEIVLGDLVLNQASHGARLAGRPLDLTPTEFRLASYLAAHPGRAFTRTQLLHDVWHHDCDESARTITVHVQRLRAKLGRDNQRLIDTVRGVGYMAPLPADASDSPKHQQHSGNVEHFLAG